MSSITYMHMYVGLCMPVYAITKTCLYNFDPHKPYFYILTVVYRGAFLLPFYRGIHYFSYFAKSIDAVLTSTHNLCFEQEYENISEFFIWKVSFFGWKMFNIFE